MLKERNAGKLARCVLILVAVVPGAMSETMDPIRTAPIVNPVQQIAHAVTLAGFSVSAQQIELLSGTGSPRKNASMKVVGMTDAAPGTIKVKLRCRDSHECLPFYVLVHGVDRVKVGSAKEGAMPPSKASSRPNVVRGGDRAILILETPDSRLSFPVICLQGGTRGQKVRVTST